MTTFHYEKPLKIKRYTKLWDANKLQINLQKSNTLIIP